MPVQHAFDLYGVPGAAFAGFEAVGFELDGNGAEAKPLPPECTCIRGGTASVVRVCGPEAGRITQELTAQGKKLNTNVRWVEVYRVRRWQSAFHDSIYQLRTQGFKQDTYRKFQLQGWDDAETLVYTNSAGKYVGMISRGTSADGASSIFALYGN
ncbi:hypothetical protein [Deinococcus hopiensis]|uniref:hypothetical protein n=1 Tax=Deinococcus hopiensis TaxID=309885 RepID=UPI0014827F7B|nr:hypothetical protein [Deinococcus hopiensis]